MVTRGTDKKTGKALVVDADEHLHPNTSTRTPPPEHHHRAAAEAQARVCQRRGGHRPRAGIRASALDLAEFKEAFAAQATSCAQQLEIKPDFVNVGAISLGHPLGASGARLVPTLVTELSERFSGGATNTKSGLASMCIGVGQGIAALWEPV